MPAKKKIADGRLDPGQHLADLPEFKGARVFAYRWVPDYAADTLRPGDYLLLDPEEGRHYGGTRGKRLKAFLPASELEYRQNDEFVWNPVRPRLLDVQVHRPESADGGKRRHGVAKLDAEVRGLLKR